MIIKFPGNKYEGMSVDKPIQLIDIISTIIGILQEKKDTLFMDRISILGPINNGEIFCEFQLYKESSHFFSLYKVGFKLHEKEIKSPLWKDLQKKQGSLYYLKTNPREKTPIPLWRSPDLYFKFNRSINRFIKNLDTKSKKFKNPKIKETKEKEILLN